MCPHTTGYVSSYYDICVSILLAYEYGCATCRMLNCSSQLLIDLAKLLKDAEFLSFQLDTRKMQSAPQQRIFSALRFLLPQILLCFCYTKCNQLLTSGSSAHRHLFVSRDPSRWLGDLIHSPLPTHPPTHTRPNLRTKDNEKRQ